MAGRGVLGNVGSRSDLAGVFRPPIPAVDMPITVAVKVEASAQKEFWSVRGETLDSAFGDRFFPDS